MLVERNFMCLVRKIVGVREINIYVFFNYNGESKWYFVLILLYFGYLVL